MAEAHLTRLSDLRPGSRFHGYELLEMIGAGGQGVVWSGLERARGRIVAIKFDEMSGTSLAEDDRVLLPQADVLLRLRHAHVLPLYDLGVSGQLQYMVSPYISGGSLADWLRQGNLTTEDALRCMAEVAAGLDYLHTQGVIHRDLKPGNVLLGIEQHAYITDFGLARVLSATTRAMHTGRGTPLYAPPEQHAMAKITPQSDIFSLGIMFYELLTRLIPWGGEKALGVEQLHAKAEIPDPCEIDPDLPGGLVQVLRQMTAAEPGARPVSASEAVRMIFELFGLPLPSSAANEEKTVLWLRNAGADDLLTRSLDEWRRAGEAAGLGLTRFALLDLHQRQAGLQAIPEDARRFMLHQALAYGYEDKFWWGQAAGRREKLELAAELVQWKNPAATARLIRHLRDDPALAGPGVPPGAELTSALLDLAGKVGDPRLRTESLQVLLRLLPPGAEWRQVAISAEQDAALAGLALDDSPQGNRAGELIGHLRSLTAVRTLARTAPRPRRLRALRQVWEAAGSLPAVVPPGIRLGIFFRWLAGRLTARPLRSLAAFALTSLGATLGFGTVAFLSYRLPEYFDNTRLRISFERGWFLGIAFGIGLVLTRLFAGRLARIRPLPRCLLAAAAGGIILNASTVAYYAAILNTPAQGSLILAGSLLMALGFALGAIPRGRLWRIAISLLASFAAIAGTWGLHVALAAVPTDLTPILKFEYGLPAAQVLGLTSIAVLPLAVLGNLVDLDEEEKA